MALPFHLGCKCYFKHLVPVQLSHYVFSSHYVISLGWGVAALINAPSELVTFHTLRNRVEFFSKVLKDVLDQPVIPS